MQKKSGVNCWGRDNWRQFWNGDVAIWIINNLTPRFGDHWLMGWHIFFGVTLWFIWQWRNARVFTNAKEISDEAIIMHYVQDMKAVMNMESEFLSRPGQAEVLVGWNKPRRGVVKINTNGSCKGNPGLISTRLCKLLAPWFFC